MCSESSNVLSGEKNRKSQCSLESYPSSSIQLYSHCFQVDVHAGMLHDAVLLWAYAVNKTITALGSSELDNGTAVTTNAINFTFEGTDLPTLSNQGKT